MEEVNYTPLAKFDIEPSLSDKFWFEQIKRAIQECNSVKDLKEMATLLAQIATQRQGIIKGLVKDMQLFNAVSINPDDLANPPVITNSK